MRVAPSLHLNKCHLVAVKGPGQDSLYSLQQLLSPCWGVRDMNCQAVVGVFITVRDQGRCNYGRKYCDYCHACHPASVPCHETNVTDISDDLNIQPHRMCS